jgi:hypothetical protein
MHKISPICSRSVLLLHNHHYISHPSGAAIIIYADPLLPDPLAVRRLMNN